MSTIAITLWIALNVVIGLILFNFSKQAGNYDAQN